jgi:hypothetical protein
VTSPAQLLDTARALLTRADPTTAGLWPRASALLARQALESALDSFWHTKGLPHLASCSSRAQLICLRAYLKEEGLAGQAQQLWSSLSRACHHHPYELAPTVGELEGWMESSERLVGRLGAAGAATRE